MEAGFDRFPPDLMWHYFAEYCADRLRISFDDLMALGRSNGGDKQEPFNMAYLAVRGSGAVNGVSRLHGEVSRHLFQPLFPRWPAEEVPVGHVTNGVHEPTWDSAHFREGDDGAIWKTRNEARKTLVEYIRERYARQLAIQGECSQTVADGGQVFDFNALTLGFARRFATYKRPNLLLHDPARLMRILRNAERPVQLVIAGKAHPKDGAGQEMIRQWMEFIRGAGQHSPVIFLADYDMLLTGELVGGVDVWLNTPRRPWEASGTSGMKVLVNGGLNLSELDGWWAEAYTPEVGWALGDGREHGEDPAWDAAEAEALYGLLEQQVTPEFYERNNAGIPGRSGQAANPRRDHDSPDSGLFSGSCGARVYDESLFAGGGRLQRRGRLRRAKPEREWWSGKPNLAQRVRPAFVRSASGAGEREWPSFRSAGLSGEMDASAAPN